MTFALVVATLTLSDLLAPHSPEQERRRGPDGTIRVTFPSVEEDAWTLAHEDWILIGSSRTARRLRAVIV
jgi:hypothetical protein